MMFKLVINTDLLATKVDPKNFDMEIPRLLRIAAQELEAHQDHGYLITMGDGTRVGRYSNNYDGWEIYPERYPRKRCLVCGGSGKNMFVTTGIFDKCARCLGTGREPS